jgi:type I restriction enzyme R subunit
MKKHLLRLDFLYLFFLIFDICGNFEFFEDFPDGYKPTIAKPLHQQLFEAQLDIVVSIQNNPNASEQDDEVAKLYKENLFGKINQLDTNRFEFWYRYS